MTNYFIKPHPGLAVFVETYILSTSGETSLTFTGNWAASNETSLVFFLADKPEHWVGRNGKTENNEINNWVVGLLTRSNGFVSFSGNYKTFVIQFKPNGFSKIFNLPASELTDQVFLAEDVFGMLARDLWEQLLNAADIQEMARFSDFFLLHFLNKQKGANEKDGITFVSNQLLTCTGNLDVAGYASQANMSLRNFERRFNEQVGISPKLFFRLIRFNNSVNAKVRYPEKSWTEIAHEFGYYDQMHLIKDFRDFTELTPTTFFQQSPGIQDEQFIAVKRTTF